MSPEVVAMIQSVAQKVARRQSQILESQHLPKVAQFRQIWQPCFWPAISLEELSLPKSVEISFAGILKVKITQDESDVTCSYISLGEEILP